MAKANKPNNPPAEPVTESGELIEITADEPIQLRPTLIAQEAMQTMTEETPQAADGPTLITLTHSQTKETIEVTEAVWAENRARLELEGYRHPGEDREVLTPPGERYQHSTGTGFVRD